MNKESTLYDYTRSAEELRVFELGETCSLKINNHDIEKMESKINEMKTKSDRIESALKEMGK